MALERIRLNEASSRTITFTLTDQAGDPVPLADLATAQLTLYDVETLDRAISPTEGIINGRDAQDVLNSHDVTIHGTSGLVTWLMQPSDNPIITARRQVERHRAEFRFVTVTGAELDCDPIEIEVANLARTI